MRLFAALETKKILKQWGRAKAKQHTPLIINSQQYFRARDSGKVGAYNYDTVNINFKEGICAPAVFWSICIVGCVYQVLNACIKRMRDCDFLLHEQSFTRIDIAYPLYCIV